MILKTVKYRLYPNNKQRTLINKHIGCCRYVYNWALNIKITTYQKEKKTIGKYDLMNMLPFLKRQPETNWLSEIDSQALQQSLVRLDKAFTKFFRDKKGFPKFHSKHNSVQSFTNPHPLKIHYNTHKIQIAKIGKVKAKIHAIIEESAKQYTVTKTPTGKYFISIAIETNEQIKDKEPISENSTIGIDTGIKTFITASNGLVFENNHYLKNSLQRLKILQKRVSKKVKGSNNRKKANYKTAKLHEKIKNQRLDYIHKVTDRLTNDNQISTICIEDLNVKGMVQNHKLAQSLNDVSLGVFYTILQYKADWRGKNILKIGRFDASSRTCNKCGKLKSDLTLADREWICECGNKIDRDQNASMNIKDWALHPKNKSGAGSPVEPVEMSAMAESMKQEYCMVKPLNR